MSRIKKAVFAVITVAACYGLLESLLTLRDPHPAPHSFMIFEEAGRTLQFDSIRGYRLTGTPSRVARIIDGRVEFVGTLRGNSEGFPDRDDFGPRRRSADVPRVAVFGDSFTAGFALGLSWPDRAEDMTRERGREVELSSFAVDGAGLANWWSILTRLVGPQDYEIDGVLFAVFCDNLTRGFTILDLRDADEYVFARLSDWDPAGYPTTLEEARQHFQPWAGETTFVVSAEEFEAVIQGKTPDRLRGPFRLALADVVARRLAALRSGPAMVWLPSPEKYVGRAPLIEDIRAFLVRRDVPALVVHIPWRDHLVAGVAAECEGLRDAQGFARRIGAQFLDGSRIFDGMNEEAIRSHYFPVDGHFNERGDRAFAAFIVERGLPLLLPAVPGSPG